MNELRLLLTVLFTIFLVTITISCRRSLSIGLTHEQNGAPMPIQEKNHGYYFEMKAEDLEKLSEGIDKIQIGDSLTHIIELLGEPTVAHYGVGKQNPKAKVKKSISYYVKIWEKGFVNEKYDKLVRVTFDSNDRLLNIVSNVEGIESR
jgi:hypothetical protein